MLPPVEQQHPEQLPAQWPRRPEPRLLQQEQQPPRQPPLRRLPKRAKGVVATVERVSPRRLHSLANRPRPLRRLSHPQRVRRPLNLPRANTKAAEVSALVNVLANVLANSYVKLRRQELPPEVLRKRQVRAAKAAASSAAHPLAAQSSLRAHLSSHREANVMHRPRHRRHRIWVADQAAVARDPLRANA